MKILSTLLLSVLLFSAETVLASKTNSDEEYVCVQDIDCTKLSIAPEKLTAEQFRALRDRGQTTHGNYTLSVFDQSEFQQNLPSRWRILTKKSSSIASRITLDTKGQHIFEKGSKSFLIAPYKGQDTYGGTLWFRVKIEIPAVSDPFLLEKNDKLVYVDAYESPLGEHDFINEEGTLPIARKYTFLQLAALYDGQFVRDTTKSGRKKDPRLNYNIRTFLLIAAQQEGEEIDQMSEGERKLRATELYTMYLCRHGIPPLKSEEEVLPSRFYIAIFKDMIERIFENSGYSVLSWPASEVEEKTFNLGLGSNTSPDLMLPVLTKVAVHKQKKGKVSALKMPLRFKTPTDYLALALQKKRESLSPILTSIETSETLTTPGLTNKDIAWLILRWGGIDPLERHIVGIGTEFAGNLLQRKIPMGKELCQGFVLIAHVLGRKSVADLCVDISNGNVPTKSLAEGIKSEKGLQALDKSAECLIGLLPFGGIGYSGATTLVRLFGFESPIHLLILKPGIKDVEDRALSATSNVFRTGIKSLIPGGSLLLGAGDGIAWYLGEKSLTHAGYHYLTKKKK